MLNYLFMFLQSTYNNFIDIDIDIDIDRTHVCLYVYVHIQYVYSICMRVCCLAGVQETQWPTVFALMARLSNLLLIGIQSTHARTHARTPAHTHTHTSTHMVLR